MSRLPNPEREVCTHNVPINWPCDVCDQFREPLVDKQKTQMEKLQYQLAERDKLLYDFSVFVTSVHIAYKKTNLGAELLKRHHEMRGDK
jgi:hypothetical protein